MFRRTFSTLLSRTAPLLSDTFSMPTPCNYLTEEEQMLVSSVASYSEKILKPRTKQMDEKEEQDKDVITEAFNTGLMGIEIPSELQGGGMSFFGSILAVEEIARVDPAMSATIDIQNTLVNNTFLRYANKEQQAKYLPKLATDTVGSFCLTEASSGSDAFALKTRAVKKGDKWVINGSKMFITNGGMAGIFLVMATVDPSKGYKGITCFVVDTSETSGVKVVRTEKKLGIRASSTVELSFENVEVPEENIVGQIGHGYKIAIETLNEGRIGIGAQMVGIAQGAMDTVMPYLFERKQFGQCIGDFQGMQHQYAQAYTNIHAARLMVYNAARKKMMNEPFIEDAAMAKLFASQVAEQVASKAVEWAGGIGFIRDFGLERFYRDAKIGAIYEGTSNIQLQTIAKSIKSQYTK